MESCFPFGFLETKLRANCQVCALFGFDALSTVLLTDLPTGKK